MFTCKSGHQVLDEVDRALALYVGATLVDLKEGSPRVLMKHANEVSVGAGLCAGTRPALPHSCRMRISLDKGGLEGGAMSVDAGVSRRAPLRQPR